MNQSVDIHVLQYLWQQSKPVTLNAVALAAGEQAADIVTILEDMAGRGLVALEEGGYRPLLTTTQYCVVKIRELVDQLYGGDAVAFLSDYIDAAAPEARAALREAITKGDRQS